MVKSSAALPTSNLLQTLSEGEQENYSVDGVEPQYLAEPKTWDEVEEVLSIAKGFSRNVLPRGNGTKLGIGSKPDGLGVVLLTKNMDSLIEHEHENLTFTAGAGMPLTTAQEILSKKGQFLPLDPPQSAKATLGGIAATNSSGPMRMRYGTSRDLIIELKAILPSGKSIRSGAKVVKNVAGYDMKKLFIGSYGTLGLISELTFRTYPLPESELTILAEFESAKDAIAAGRTASDTIPSLTSTQLLDDGTFGLITDSYSPSEKRSWTLAVRIDGYSSVIPKWSPKISQVCSSSGSRHSEELNGDESKKFWTSVNEIEDNPLVAGSVHLRISVPRVATASIIDAISKAGSDRNLELVISALPSLGTLDVFLLNQHGAQIVEDLRALAIALDGNLIVNSAPSEMKGTLDVWGPSPPEFRLMKAIKENLDPDRIMTSGRFIGGL